MPSQNIAVIEGHAGRDAEVRQSQRGTPVLNLSVATSEYAGKDKERRPEWHNIVAFGQLAENASAIRKGYIVRLFGRLQTRSWEKDGVKRYSTEIVADSMTWEPPRGEGGAQQQARPQQRTAAPDPFSDEGDSDIPY